MLTLFSILLGCISSPLYNHIYQWKWHSKIHTLSIIIEVLHCLFLQNNSVRLFIDHDLPLGDAYLISWITKPTDPKKMTRPQKKICVLVFYFFFRPNVKVFPTERIIMLKYVDTAIFFHFIFHFFKYFFYPTDRPFPGMDLFFF